MKIAGLSFDHMHMNDLLQDAFNHPDAQIVGVADDNRSNAPAVQNAVSRFELQPGQVFDDYAKCLETTRPDIAVLCPAIAEHAHLTELAAGFGAHVLVEKPFAFSLSDADRMIAACQKNGVKLAINWPTAWYPVYNTVARLLREGTIGPTLEVHHYGGNAGPLSNLIPDEMGREEANRFKNGSWFYKKASGGGSLIDYMGYGATLGTWFHDGQAPLEVATMWDIPAGLEVDEHSLSAARYATGISKFETRWGTFSDPWELQPQPKCGFTIVGESGTICAFEYDDFVRVQTREHPEGLEVPANKLTSPNSNPIEHFIAHIEGQVKLHPCLTPPVCRTGQQIVDTAIASATQKRTLELLK